MKVLDQIMKFNQRNNTTNISVFMLVWIIIGAVSTTTCTFSSAFVVSTNINEIGHQTTTVRAGRFENSNTNSYQNRKYSSLISSISPQSVMHPVKNSIGSIRKNGGLQRLHLFGLGVGEIVLILIGVGVVLGPSGIKNVIKESAVRAVEMKNEASTIPKEFQKGLEIGEIEARSRKAKRIVVNNKATTSEDESDQK